MSKKITLAILATTALVSANPALADDKAIAELRKEIKQMQKLYQKRIDQLEKKITTLQKQPDSAVAQKIEQPARNVYDRSFNPSIGVVLNGKYQSFSQSESEMAGFAIGEEGERGREGLGIDESELNFSASIDDKFQGSLTAAIVREDGEDKVELEEAYIETLPGLHLPEGLSLRAGRAFWKFGYLNEHHAHADDFADRPLPYRVFLNKAFNDDGVQASYVLPTEFYSEIGGGLFRGDDFPSGGSDGDGIDSYSVFARIGGDIGTDHHWRLGGYFLSSDVASRESNEGDVTFAGDQDLYAVDLRYGFAPTGNAKNQEIILQGEYFYRKEDGTYDVGAGAVNFDDHSSGWYGQAVYKFAPEWRVGYRYTELEAADTPAGLVGTTLDSNGHDPYIHSTMLDWTNSEFSRLRFQYNYDKTVDNQTDNQFILQYIMSFGAHSAHKY